MIIISAIPEAVVVFDMIPTPSSIFRLKRLGARQNRANSTRWDLPPLVCSILRLLEAFPDADLQDPARRLLEQSVEPPKALTHPSASRLFEYQREAIRFLVDPKLRGKMLSLSPGLGKTAVSIVAAESVSSQSILVVAPLTLLGNWQREIQRWGTLASTVVRRSGVYETPWVITNYDYLSRHSDEFQRPWDVVILDESILVKNRLTIRSKSIETLSKDARRVWAVSGSPISTSAIDLYNQFKILLPDYFRSYWRFADLYCIVETSPWGKSILGSRPGINLREEFRDFVMIRDQREVIDLPEEVYETVELDLLPIQRRLHDRLLKDFILELSTRDVPIQTRMTQILKMLQVVSNAGTIQTDLDISVKTDAIEEMLEGESLPLPVIIWVHWRATGQLLFSRLADTKYRVGYLSSSLDAEERTREVEKFQSGQLDILIVSLGVGKFGVTLTSARSMIYYDRSYDADAIVQSSYRVHRLGLTHPVTIYTLRCPRTADDLVDSNLSRKIEDISSLTNAQLVDLLRTLS